MTSTVHKVTCLITHRGSQNTELLLFRHPNAGIQIPAGTAEPDETPEVAAWREAAEESGLTGIVLKRQLGEVDERYFINSRVKPSFIFFASGRSLARKESPDQ